MEGSASKNRKEKIKGSVCASCKKTGISECPPTCRNTPKEEVILGVLCPSCKKNGFRKCRFAFQKKRGRRTVPAGCVRNKRPKNDQLNAKVDGRNTNIPKVLNFPQEERDTEKQKDRRKGGKKRRGRSRGRKRKRRRRQSSSDKIQGKMMGMAMKTAIGGKQDKNTVNNYFNFQPGVVSNGGQNFGNHKSYSNCLSPISDSSNESEDNSYTSDDVSDSDSDVSEE